MKETAKQLKTKKK